MLVIKTGESSSNAVHLKALLINVEDLDRYVLHKLPFVIFPTHKKAINGAISFGLFMYLFVILIYYQSHIHLRVNAYAYIQHILKLTATFVKLDLISISSTTCRFNNLWLCSLIEPNSSFRTFSNTQKKLKYIKFNKYKSH